MAKDIRKKNFFVRYFSNFGLRQICDILMIIGAIVLIVGLSFSGASVDTATNILIAGLAVFMVASLLAIIRAVLVLVSKINHRSPEYKRAIVNTVIMSIVFVLALFGFIWALLV